MKKAFFILISAILLSSCTTQGPMGPQGETGDRGPQGEVGPQGETVTYRIYTITGTFDSTTSIQWDIPYAESIPEPVPENAIVNCRIRNGSDGSKFMWREVTYFSNTEIVRIMKSEITHIGDEYIITVLIP
jgi:hypothetical protein